MDFSPRFDFPLSPRSIFHPRQRFLLPNHVTSGCLSPRFFLPLVSGFEPAIPLATNGQRLHFRLATARTNQKPEPDPSGPPLLLSCSSQLNPAAEQIGKALAYCLILVVSLFGNSLIAIIVYRTQTLRKPVNFFTVNMAMSDLLYSIFYIPCTLAGLYLDSWLISGLLGQALCKLYFILSTVSSFLSIQSLILRALDSGCSLRPALISSKLCPLLILATWIVALGVCWPYFFTIRLVEYPSGKLVCELPWNEAFDTFLLHEVYIFALHVLFQSLYPHRFVVNTLLHHPYKDPDANSSGGTIRSTPKKSAREEFQTETCLRWPLLSL